MQRVSGWCVRFIFFFFFAVSFRGRSCVRLIKSDKHLQRSRVTAYLLWLRCKCVRDVLTFSDASPRRRAFCCRPSQITSRVISGSLPGSLLFRGQGVSSAAYQYLWLLSNVIINQRCVQLLIVARSFIVLVSRLHCPILLYYYIRCMLIIRRLTRCPFSRRRPSLSNRSVPNASIRLFSVLGRLLCLNVLWFNEMLNLANRPPCRIAKQRCHPLWSNIYYAWTGHHVLFCPLQTFLIHGIIHPRNHSEI